MKRTNHYRLLLATLLITAGALFAPALRFPFIWDDTAVVRDNPYLRSSGSAGLFFRPAYWEQMLPISRSDYRPLQMITLAAVSRPGGRNPLFFRAVNLSLHLLACLLIWTLSLRLETGKPAALLAAAFFAFHPVHVETVFNARNIAELMPAVLLLSAFILFLRPPGGIGLAGAAAGFLGALLYKESAIIFPAILTATVLTAGRVSPRKSGLRHTVPFWLIAAAAGAAKIMLSGSALKETPPLPPFIVGVSRLSLVYFRLLLFPARLKTLYSFFKPVSFATPGSVLALLAAAALLLTAARVARKDRLLRWSLICLLLSLLPAFFKIGQIGRIVAEQRLYFPSSFFCIAGALIIRRVYEDCRRRGQVLTVISVIVICLALFGLSEKYLVSWQSEISLWTRVTDLSPRAALARNNLAIAFHRQGDDERAREELEIALRLSPGHKEAHSNLGVLHALSGRWEEASVEFKESLKSDPSYHPASLHLAEVYLRMRRLAEAEEIVRKVLKANPYIPQAWNDLAIVLEERGRTREAEEAYREAARLNPEYVSPLRNLTRLYHERKDFDRAVETGREAIRRQPEHPGGYITLSSVYVTRGRFADARELLEEGRRRHPGNREIKSRLLALESVGPD
ncbi:MAG: tetratricopeptide repeat protein [PVC group bacterium]